MEDDFVAIGPTVGTGSFGKIKPMLHVGSQTVIAYKSFHSDIRQHTRVVELEEADTWRKHRHPNVLALVGFVSTDDGIQGLIFPWCHETLEDRC